MAYYLSCVGANYTTCMTYSDTPCTTPFGTPCMTPFGTPCMTPFGTPCMTPFGTPCMTPFGTPCMGYNSASLFISVRIDGRCITPCFSRHIGVGDGNLSDGWLGSISISHADARRISSAIGHYHSVRDCDISASSAAGRAYTCASKSGISTTSGGMNRNIADSDIAADCTAPRCLP